MSFGSREAEKGRAMSKPSVKAVMAAQEAYFADASAAPGTAAYACMEQALIAAYEVDHPEDSPKP